MTDRAFPRKEDPRAAALAGAISTSCLDIVSKAVAEGARSDGRQFTARGYRHRFGLRYGMMFKLIPDGRNFRTISAVSRRGRRPIAPEKDKELSAQGGVAIVRHDHSDRVSFARTPAAVSPPAIQRISCLAESGHITP